MGLRIKLYTQTRPEKLTAVVGEINQSYVP